MDLENPVSPVAETQNPAPEVPANETPEVAEPESNQPEGNDEPDPRDKTVKSLTRRVDRVTAARYQAEARAQQAEQEREALRQRLAQYEQPQEQPTGPDPIVLAKEIAKIERVTERANSIAKDGAARFENFKPALQTIAREAGPLFDQIGRPSPLFDAIRDADDPAAVLHHIGSDPDLAAEFADLTPAQMGRRVARIEAELSKPKEPPKSAAPKPIAPVKATGADTGLSNSLPVGDWAKRFLQQRQQRR